MLFETIILKLPVHTPFAIASGTMTTADSVMLRVSTGDNQLSGFGEAAPFHAVSGEELTGLEQQISWAGMEINRALQAANHSSHQQDFKSASIFRTLSRLQKDPEFSRPALCAIECAIIDLLARSHNMALARFFGGNPQTRIETDITVPVMNPESVPGFLERFSKHAFKTFKIKVSGNMDQDIECCRAVAEWNTTRATEHQIILDGNQGYNVDSARKLIVELDRININVQCFEQPLPKDDLLGLARLQSAIDVPILLDESVATILDLQRVATAKAGRMINIKITKSGVIESLRLITAAKSLGFGLMIGGMLETEIAMGFSLHIAAGTGGFNWIDLDTPFFLTAPLTSASPWLNDSSHLMVPTGPGLAIRLDFCDKPTANVVGINS